MRIPPEVRKHFAFIFIVMIFLSAGFSSTLAQQAITIHGQGCVVTASSYCDEYEDIQFTPNKAFNGKPDRPWMSADEFEPGDEEWIKVTFTNPVKLLALRISPGFGRGGEYYYRYPRLKRFEVILDRSGKTETRTYHNYFDSSPAKDLVLLYSTQPVVKSIKLKILDVYPGETNNQAVIGNIEPVIVKGGKVFSSSWSVEEAIAFLKSTQYPEKSFAFVPRGRTMTLSRIIQNSNPIDESVNIKKAINYNRKRLREEWATWKTICFQIWKSYQFNTYESVNYLWKDESTGLVMFDMIGSINSDVINSYTLGMTRQKVTEVVKQKDEETNEEKEIKVTVLRTVLPYLKMTQDVYTP